MNYKRIKILRSKLKRRVVSSWSQISDPNLTEILCHKKFDCLTFDLEHGIFNIKDLSSYKGFRKIINLHLCVYQVKI